MRLQLTDRELATVLAALRRFQEQPDHRMPHFTEQRPLTARQIDHLCDRLNTKGGK